VINSFTLRLKRGNSKSEKRAILQRNLSIDLLRGDYEDLARFSPKFGVCSWSHRERSVLTHESFLSREKNWPAAQI
jgi:hypothetical protein